MLSPSRQALIVSAAIPLGVCLAATPGVVHGFERGYSSGLEQVLTGLSLVGVALTIAALGLVIQSWRGKVRPLYAVLASAVATAAILVLSVAMGLGG